MDRVSAGATAIEAIETGSSASRSSDPGSRSLLTSTGLIALMPFGMKVLSPQFSTCLPSRRSTAASPTSNAPVT